MLVTTSTVPLTMSIELIVEGGRPEGMFEYEMQTLNHDTISQLTSI